MTHRTASEATQQHDAWYAAALTRRLAIDLLRATRDESIAAKLKERHELARACVTRTEKSRIVHEALEFIDNAYLEFDKKVAELPGMTGLSPSFT